jgi:hypothetical protein
VLGVDRRCRYPRPAPGGPAAAVSAQKFWNMKQPSPVMAAAVATLVPLPIRLSQMIPVEPVTRLMTIVIVAPMNRMLLRAISQ